MTFDVNAVFEDELSRRGVSFVKEEEYVYRVTSHGRTISASLENVRRNAERDQDPDAIRRFVDKVLSPLPPIDTPWSEASTLLLWSAEPTDTDFEDSIHISVTDEVSRVLTLTDLDHGGITWVTPRMCAQWGVTVEHAASVASANQELLLNGVCLDVHRGEQEGDAIGMIPLDSPYKASTIFATAFKRLVEPALGWPVLVVVPCRDFVYVVANESPLLGSMGSVVVNEFRNSGYPITTEVLRISDDGIEAIGRFES
jgi:hypothetical protein